MADTTAENSSHEPTLSRRVKSCEACRKMKVKCIFEPHQAALFASNNTVESEAARCRRCIVRNLQCHVSSNLQSILEKDLSWKARLQDQLERQQEQIERLNEAIERLTRHTHSTNSSHSSNVLDMIQSPRHRSKRPRLHSDLQGSQAQNPLNPSNSVPREEVSNLTYGQEGNYSQDQVDFYEEDDIGSSFGYEVTPPRASSSNSGLAEPAPHVAGTQRSQRPEGQHSYDPPSVYRRDANDARNNSTPWMNSTSTHAQSDCTPVPRASPTSNSVSAYPDSVLPIRAFHQKQTDLITRSLLHLTTAQELFHFYVVHLDTHIYHLLRVCFYDHPSRGPDKLLVKHASDAWLEELRSSSTLLLLAVLAVAALHRRDIPVHARRKRGGMGVSGAHPFQLLYREYVRLAATLSFSRQLTLDDIRALVIGAFWLPDISWILVGTAVRVATERGLHLSYKKTTASSDNTAAVAMTPSSDPSSSSSTHQREADMELWYQEARLYFVIYLVDHHASIPHGRPPMTRQHSVIRHASEWLSRCSCNTRLGLRAPDQRLISHTQLWEILHDVIDFVGTDVNKPLDRETIELSAQFGGKLKRWMDETLFRTSLLHSGPEVEKALDEVRVVHGFAYLFLESSAFRAPVGCLPDFIYSAASAPTSSQLIMEKRAMAERATTVALKLICALGSPRGTDSLRLRGESLRFAPAWMYSMLVSSLVFVVKVHEMLDTNCCSDLLPGCSKHHTLQGLTGAVRALEEVAASVSEPHIVRKILDGAKGLARQLAAMTKQTQPRTYPTPSSTFTPAPNGNLTATFSNVVPPSEVASPLMEISRFDLLSDLHPISGLDFWPEIIMDSVVTGGEVGIDSLLRDPFAT